MFEVEMCYLTNKHISTSPYETKTGKFTFLQSLIADRDKFKFIAVKKPFIAKFYAWNYK